MKLSTGYKKYVNNAYLFKKLKENPNIKLCGIAEYDANAYKFLDLMEECYYEQTQKEEPKQFIAYDRAS